MSDYPSAIYSPREKLNQDGVVYDAEVKTVAFAEDIVNLDNEVVAIENALGLNPAGGYESVAARLEALIASTIPSGLIFMWSGAIETIPEGFYLCDGNNGTPNLFGKFILGAGGEYAVGATGGSFSTEAVQVSIADHQITDEGHYHTGETYGHTHSVYVSGVNTVDDSGAANFINDVGIETGSSQDSFQTASEVTGLTLSAHEEPEGHAHSFAPPYYALAFIMKS